MWILLSRAADLWSLLPERMRSWIQSIGGLVVTWLSNWLGFPLWQAAVIGVGAVLIFAIPIRLRRQLPLSRWDWLVMVGFLLLVWVAVIFDYYDRHHPQDQQSYVTSQQQPIMTTADGGTGQNSHFVIALDNLFFIGEGNTNIRTPDVKQNLVIVVASVRNLSDQSIAEGWKMTIRVGKNEYVGKPITPPDRFFYYLSKRGVSSECLRFYWKDSLVNKTMTPLPFGGMQRGVMVYNFPEVLQEEILREHAVVTLECKDANGRMQRVSQMNSDSPRSDESPEGITTEILPLGQCDK